MNRRFNDDDDDDRPKKKAAKAVPRRSALKTTGLAVGGVLGLSVAGVAGRAYQTNAFGSFTEGPGFDLMRNWQAQVGGAKIPELHGKPAGLIAAGLLAASPHNTQPWTFRVTDRVIDVMADDTRALGPIDAAGRELAIGMGCCIENMSLGASGVAINPLLNMFPDGPDGKVVARFTVFDSGDQPNDRAKALARRHTNRGPYVVARPIDQKIIDALEALNTSSNIRMVWLRSETEAGKRFADGTVKATADFIADAEMREASDKWFRFTPGPHTDGLTLPTVGLPPLTARLALMLPPGLTGDSHQKWLEMTRDVHVATAPLFGLFAVDSVDRPTLVEVGRLWQRLHIQTTIMGLAVQPLNQLLEMADRDASLNRTSSAADTLSSLATLGSGRFVFAFRMGYSRFITNPSPRRRIDDVIARA
jgi:hypothetical protein